jgi:hypothetical protein
MLELQRVNWVIDKNHWYIIRKSKTKKEVAKAIQKTIK